MRIIKKLPGQRPEVVDTENTLEALQEAVGGYIEAVTFAEDAALICNEEGRLLGLQHNCTVLGIPFVGPVLAVGVAGEEFRGLRDEQLQLMLELLDR